jgi:hemoglobin/transferrin/lactoferrin receptor protein
MRATLPWLGALGLLAWASSLSAQSLRLTDEETGAPIEGATLEADTPGGFVLTDAQGRADLSAFRGAEAIVLRAMGYHNVTLSYARLDSAGFQWSLRPTPIPMDEVVVSATRWRQHAGDVPSKISTVRPEQVALQNPQTAADLLDLSGEVFIQKSQQGGGSPMIRGFATNRLLYSVDGVRMNNAIFRGGNLQNVISLDPFAIENTEVLFGPGSVIYGSDAIGGVMSFQTLRPRWAPDDSLRMGGSAVVRTASANRERTGHVDINLGGRKLASVTSFSYNRFDDLKMGSDGPDAYLKPYTVERIDGTDRVVANEDPEVQVPSAYTQIHLMQKLRYRLGRRWNCTYGFHYSETSDYGRFDRHLRRRNGRPRYAQWDYGPQRWMMNQWAVTHQRKHSFFDEATLRLAFQQFEESRIDRDFNALLQRNRIENVDAYSANLNFRKALKAGHELFYGAEWVRNEVRSEAFHRNIQTGARTPIGARYPASQWASYALYLTDYYALRPELNLQAGLRYNHFAVDARFDTAFYDFPFTEAHLDNGALTGNLGLSYRPDERWVLRGQLSTAFRAPNVDDIGKVFDSEPGAVIVPNPKLEAEYSYNAELGAVRRLGERLKVDASVFYTRLENALVRRDFRLDGRDSILYDGVLSQVQALQNAAFIRVYGLQAGLEARLPGGFSFSSDFNFQEGVEELEDGSTSPSRHAAPWFGVSRLSLRRRGLELQAYAEYSGEVAYQDLALSERGKPELYAPDGNGNHYAPGWYTLNFKALYPLHERLTLSAGVENITDQRYRPYSSGIAAPGRNFILSLRADF